MFVHILYSTWQTHYHIPGFPLLLFSQPGIQRGQGADALSDHKLAFFTDFGNAGLSGVKSG